MILPGHLDNLENLVAAVMRCKTLELFVRQSRAVVQRVDGFDQSRKLSDVDAADYDAILVPGGLGPMVDIQRNADVQKAIVRAWTTDKLVTAVCHGPCSLLGVDLGDGKPFVSGRKVTGFSTKEEYDYAREDVPYELEEALRAEGGDYSSAANWEPHVVVDGRLITGQNPASAAPLAKELLAALQR